MRRNALRTNVDRLMESGEVTELKNPSSAGLLSAISSVSMESATHFVEQFQHK